MKKKKRVGLIVRLNPETHNELKKICFYDDVSMNKQICSLINEWICKRSK